MHSDSYKFFRKFFVPRPHLAWLPGYGWRTSRKTIHLSVATLFFKDGYRVATPGFKYGRRKHKLKRVEPQHAKTPPSFPCLAIAQGQARAPHPGAPEPDR